MKKKIDDVIEQSLKTSSAYIKWIAVVVLVGVLFSGITFVQSGEVAIVLRFGKLVGAAPSEQVRRPGLHFSLPSLIDKVVRIPVQKVQEVRIDGLYTKKYISSITETGYALTGDDNIVLIEAVLKYKIIDPIKYTIEIEQPETDLKELTTAALTHKVASMSVDDVLTKRKMELAKLVLQDSQERADRIGLGVQLIAIEFTNLQPPREVRDSFDLVTSAYVQNETKLQEAERYKEKVLPEAIAERDSMIQSAKSYKIENIASANSDVAQFYGVIEEYKNNPLIVRERLYREKVENIMKNIANKVLVPEGEGGENIILP